MTRCDLLVAMLVPAALAAPSLSRLAFDTALIKPSTSSSPDGRVFADGREKRRQDGALCRSNASGRRRPAAFGSNWRTSGVPLFTAIQEQLGLKLDAQKKAIEVLVVDRAAHPTSD